MLLYIHGFGSCGQGNKVVQLKKYFGANDVLSPDLSHDPPQAMAQLEELIAAHPVDMLLGSSLGGYYAEWLNGRHGIPSVLINPSTQPQITLARLIGPNKEWCTGKTFNWTAKQVESLGQFQRERPGASERYLLIVQTGDEVLDYRLAAERYRDYEVVITQGGNHRFESLEPYLPRIALFREQFSRSH